MSTRPHGGHGPEEFSQIEGVAMHVLKELGTACNESCPEQCVQKMQGHLNITIIGISPSDNSSIKIAKRGKPRGTKGESGF